MALVKLEGLERDAYVQNLQAALTRFAEYAPKDLPVLMGEYARLQQQQKPWRRDVAPHAQRVLSWTGNAIKDVAALYGWFTTIDNAKPFELNRHWYDRIDLDTTSGLPNWFELLGLKTRNEEGYTSIAFPAPEHQVSAMNLAGLFEDDAVDVKDIPEHTRNIRLGSLRRSFLDQIVKAKLPPFEGKQPYRVERLGQEGIDDIWGVQYVNVTAENAIPHVTSFVLAQEPGTNLIDVTVRGIEIAPELKFPLMGQQNESWYFLQKLDAHPGIRPLFVSRLVLGPYETAHNKYGDDIVKRLKVVRELAKEENVKGILQCSHLYGFSPNTITKKEGDTTVTVQDISPTEQRDELLVAPAGLSKELGTRLLGQRVRIYEY